MEASVGGGANEKEMDHLSDCLFDWFLFGIAGISRNDTGSDDVQPGTGCRIRMQSVSCIKTLYCTESDGLY